MDIYGCLGCGEAADHTITKKQRTSLSLFLCHTHGIVWYVFVLCILFICISEAHNGTKYIFHEFFSEGSHLNIKEDILKYKSANFNSFINFLNYQF